MFGKKCGYLNLIAALFLFYSKGSGDLLNIINLTLQEFEEFKKNIFLNKKHFVTLVYIKDYAYVTISKLNAINIMEFIYYKNKDFTSTFLLEHYSLDGTIIKKITYNNGEPNSIDDTPAIITYDEKGNVIKELFIKDGYYHNINGPAIKEYSNGYCTDCTYCINNVRFTEKNYFIYINSIKDGTIINMIPFSSYNKISEIKEIAKYYNNAEIEEECEKQLVIKKLENQ